MEYQKILDILTHINSNKKNAVVDTRNLRVYRLRDLTLQLFLTTTMTNEYLPYLGSLTPVLHKKQSGEAEDRLLDGVKLIINLFDYVSIPSDMYTYRSSGNKYIARYNTNEFKKAIAFLYSIQAIRKENEMLDESRYTLAGIFSKSGYDSLLSIVKKYITDILIAYIAILDSDIIIDNSVVDVTLSIPLILTDYIYDSELHPTELQEIYPREEIGQTGFYSNRINFLNRNYFLNMFYQVESSEFIVDILSRLMTEDEQLAYRLNFKNFIRVLLDKEDPNHAQAVVLLVSYYCLKEKDIIVMEES